MRLKNQRGILMLITLLGLATAACQLFNRSAGGPPRNAAVITVTANTSLGPWLETAVADFNAARIETSGGDPAYVQLELIEAGQMVLELSKQAIDGPALWIPDDKVWTNVAADQGNPNYQNDCVSVAESPLVIALWRPLAESLGWPGRDLGWFDIDSLASDPSAWTYYSGNQFGDVLRLGHTHPGLSASGTSTLLALVQAAESKTEPVSPAEIQQPIVQAAVKSFESSVVSFSSSTAGLGEAMAERGINYLSAAVMYESTVLQQNTTEIIPIYPFEGTFVATHPACINQNATAEEQEAAGLFRDYLTAVAAQETAVANGLRPVNQDVAIGAPLDDSHGVDLLQPETIFGSPNVSSVYAVQELWQSARKNVNMVMLLDTSGSMRGNKMENMIAAAVQFVGQMGDDDYLTLIAFATEPQLIVHHTQVGPARNDIINQIMALRAQGDTTLYDAIGDGAAIVADTSHPDTSNALVVLTDGVDTRSYRFDFDQSLIDTARANDTTVFAIAYGSDADEQTLSQLALQANGNFYLGDEASIAAIYEEMSAAFGGSAGIGR